MVNKNLFSTVKKVPVADTKNAAGGNAYSLSAKHALAQIACTNTFNGTFYSDESSNLSIAKEAVNKLKDDPEYLAKVALYCREKSYMKDMPAFLLCSLAELDTNLFRKIFNRIVNNGKMLRNVIQIARSGELGKVRNMSAGAYRRAINNWFCEQTPKSIFNASIGNNPTMRDIILMSHIKPNTKEKAALYAYLIGGKVEDGKVVTPTTSHDYNDLPDIVKEYENFKNDKNNSIPSVDFRMLDALGLENKHWVEIARNASWTMTRMNLNTFARHGVFENSELVNIIAGRLKNPELISKAKAYPYQILNAYKNAQNLPHVISDALQDAMELSINNIPTIEGQTYIAVDCSGSMSSPITGYRRGSTTNVTCQLVAALFASALIRQNRHATIIPFGTRIITDFNLNPRDTVLTNATALSSFCMGGTNCSLPMKWLNDINQNVDYMIYISDNESWLDGYYNNAVGMQAEWQRLRARNKNAKLVCIDLTPRDNSQLKEHENVLQVGGFGDECFNVIADFLNGNNSPDKWVSIIENTEL